MLPLECRYLNKSALTTLAGPLTPPVKHFQLKRKPKSATLRAELLQKCEFPPLLEGPTGSVHTVSSSGLARWSSSRPDDAQTVQDGCPRKVQRLVVFLEIYLLLC